MIISTSNQYLVLKKMQYQTCHTDSTIVNHINLNKSYSSYSTDQFVKTYTKQTAKNSWMKENILTNEKLSQPSNFEAQEILGILTVHFVHC